MKTSDTVTIDNEQLQELRPENQLGKTALLLAVVCVAAWIANIVNGAPLLQALPGMIVLYAMVMLGLGIGRVAPFYLPSVAWVSLVSILMTLPFFPGNGWIVEQLTHVNFLAVVTPVLAYAGLALTGREFTMFRQTGWKLVIVSLLVFTGTFVGSAVVAHLML
ncbi:hypothetical protein L861_13350 [Litchfieldella anticariensis FP35 = DSM 16096]|uniref:Uncharacterized protein n=1 Tax=Litchfieldella anticariensis (strain DSM 16096 / CECT 5854 / CIP 108499 / LMG 22089 / FP35) TaxID=1121939 RepID=S2L7P8_LITA3|nr:hypothetical protein [Halomonas anticariensis]EPC00771.1 hypothetical protein L861_13350 [Halomonas anticariensis FP35 = DSM 16096]